MSNGIKYDSNKPRPDLVLGDFMSALEHPVFVGTFGAFKYAPKNFQTLEDGGARYAEAGFRHYMDRKKAEHAGDLNGLYDNESGELHIAHEIWDKMAELYFWLKDHADLEVEKAVELGGLWHHPTEDEFGNVWQVEPFWYSEADARQVLWWLAREHKGDGLPWKVHVRKKEVYYQKVDIDGDAASSVDEEMLELIKKLVEDPDLPPSFETGEKSVEEPNQPYSTAREYVVQNNADEYLAQFGKTVGGTGSSWTRDPDKALRMPKENADKYVAAMPKSSGFVRPWPVIGSGPTEDCYWIYRSDQQQYLLGYTLSDKLDDMVWADEQEKAAVLSYGRMREFLRAHPSVVVEAHQIKLWRENCIVAQEYEGAFFYLTAIDSGVCKAGRLLPVFCNRREHALKLTKSQARNFVADSEIKGLEIVEL